jgi:hypothetical protein
MPRNYIIICASLILFSSIVIPQYGVKSTNYRIISKISTCFISIIIIFSYRNYENSKREFLEYIQGEKIAIIEPATDIYSNGIIIPSFPSTYNLTEDLEKYKDMVHGFDTILAKFDQNNKQFTHYILPQLYKLKRRFGEYFIFEKIKSN